MVHVGWLLWQLLQDGRDAGPCKLQVLTPVHERRISLVTAAVTAAIVLATALLTLWSFAFSATAQVVTLTVANRLVQVYQPLSALRKARSQGVAAVFALKPSSGSPWRTRGEDGFEPFADALGFLVVYPDTQHGAADTTWGYQADLQYFAAVLRRLQEDDFALDPAQAFVCGWSSGGTMALFLQNEVDLFSAAASVEGAACKLNRWSMDRRGHRTMLFWNHADPGMASPGGDNEEAYNETIGVLRRRGSLTPSMIWPLPTSEHVAWAELRRYPPDAQAELLEVSWATPAGGLADWQASPSMGFLDWPHQWPRSPPLTFSATAMIMDFFLNSSVGPL